MPGGSLDCETPVGREYIRLQDRCVRGVAQTWEALPVMARVPDAPVDCLFYISDTVIRVAEIKCRNLSLHRLMSYGSYLITAEKLAVGIRLARELGSDFWVVVWLIESGEVLGWRVYSPYMPLRVFWRERQTKTQRTCNGGEIVRLNAYLPIKESVNICRIDHSAAPLRATLAK